MSAVEAIRARLLGEGTYEGVSLLEDCGVLLRLYDDIAKELLEAKVLWKADVEMRQRTGEEKDFRHAADLAEQTRLVGKLTAENSDLSAAYRKFESEVDNLRVLLTATCEQRDVAYATARVANSQLAAVRAALRS